MTPDNYTINEHFLDVGDEHQLYVHDWGNPRAKRTFLFLHGGPGSGCSDSHKEFFDPTRHHVVFHDQRGAGRSLPSGELTANTTQHLTGDITKIADSLGLKTFTIVGGSWGSCLALAYAIAEPERVEALILRGIFTGAQDEIDFLDKGEFRAFYPEVWEQFVERTPKEFHANPSAYHAKRILGEDETAARESAYAYSELEGSLIRLDDRHYPQAIEEFNFYGSRIEVHYLVNRCFMPDLFIVNHANKLTMPVWLVQGRYDAICAPANAYRLHQKLPNSELIWTISGHSGGDRSNYDVTKTIIHSLS